jgi:hypothetical protein
VYLPSTDDFEVAKRSGGRGARRTPNVYGAPDERRSGATRGGSSALDALRDPLGDRRIRRRSRRVRRSTSSQGDVAGARRSGTLNTIGTKGVTLVAVSVDGLVYWMTAMVWLW